LSDSVRAIFIPPRDNFGVELPFFGLLVALN
jgi:hypothetical protein